MPTELVLAVVSVLASGVWLFVRWSNKKRLEEHEARREHNRQFDEDVRGQVCRCHVPETSRADSHAEYCPKRVWLEQTTFARLDPAPWETVVPATMGIRERERISRFIQRAFWAQLTIRRELLLTELGYLAARERWTPEKRAKYSAVAKAVWNEANPDKTE